MEGVHKRQGGIVHGSRVPAVFGPGGGPRIAGDRPKRGTLLHGCGRGVWLARLLTVAHLVQRLGYEIVHFVVKA